MSSSFSFKHINPEKYSPLFSDPLWYTRLIPKFTEYFWEYDGNHVQKDQRWLETRKEWVTLIAEALDCGQIQLASEGRDWDRNRQPIDTVVVHHTKTPPNISLFHINALHLIRFYIPAHLHHGEPQFCKPLWSGHFFNDIQTFIAYHYLVFQDGTVQNPLKDAYVGWHSGHVPTNLRSIAICFVDDLMERRPTEAALESAREIIKRYHPKEILGHREVKDNRTCPGNLFLGEDGWKKELVS